MWLNTIPKNLQEKHWKQERKSTEFTEKDEFKKREEWFKENWKVENPN